MSTNGFLPEERAALVEAYFASEKRTSAPVFATLSDEELDTEYARQEAILQEYAESLPFVPVSRCPKCGVVVEYPFDPLGLDGPWWMSGAIVEYPPAEACEHFQVLLGAIDFHGREPLEAEPLDTVLPGPGVPFVVPDMLALEGVEAVLSQFELARGDTAYLVAYFSDEPLDAAHTHQAWAREVIDVKDEFGEYVGWTVSTAAWSFDLADWLDSGRLRWIAPGDEALELNEGGECPYLHLAGVRAPQIIEDGHVSTLDPPDGSEVDPTD